MIIAITGAISMLGVATIKCCIKNDISVIAFIRQDSKRIDRLPKSELVKVVECALSEMSDFDAENLYADVQIHFSWGFTDKIGRNDVSKQIKNIQYTIDAVHLAKRLGCKKFIGAGSQAEYGTPNVKLTAKTPVDSLIPYGVAKYAAVRFAAMECKKEGLEYNRIRILSIYGEHDNEGTLLNQLIHNAKKNIPMRLSGCEQIWDYLHEDDAEAAFVAVARKGVDGKIYPLGSGVGRPLKEYVHDTISVVNPDYKPEYGKYMYSPIQPMYLVADVCELGVDTGWNCIKCFKDRIVDVFIKITSGEGGDSIVFSHYVDYCGKVA